MNEQEYNNQEIIAYLLGSLPEDAAERFDELSFTDNRFADALKAAENDLIDAYARAELTGEILKRFESHYLASPLRRERVEFARVFQNFAEKNVSKKPENVFAEKTKPKRSVGGFFSALNVFNAPKFAFQLSAAILLFLVLGGLWLVVNRLKSPENQMATRGDATAPANWEVPSAIRRESLENSNIERESAAENKEIDQPPPDSRKESSNRQLVPAPPRMPKQPAQRSIVALILAPSLRDGNRLATLSIPKNTTAVAVQIQLEADDYAAYRVVLTDESGGRNLWRSSGTLKAKSKGYGSVLTLQFPAKILKSQIYSFTVSGVNQIGENEIIGNYPFRSVLK